MGVLGLMTYVLNDNKSLKAHKLRKTKVILDGNNLLHSIHHAHNVSWEFGGEYESFAKSIEKFFDRLKLCDIEPFVVFDGCYDAQGSKLSTTISRFKDRIFTCARLNKKYPCDGYLIPMLSPQTMVSVLRQLNINFVTCHEEADREAAALANFWNCPVISNDSDFFIFPLTSGFIPVSSLNFIPVEESCFCCETGSHHYLACTIFHQSNLVINRTEHIVVNGQLMPLFASLMGNDFVSPDVFYKIFDQTKAKKPSKNPSGNGMKIVSLLKWLHQFSSFEVALKKIIMSLKEAERSYVEKRINISIKQYDLQHSTLVASIRDGIDDLKNENSIFQTLPNAINQLLRSHTLSPVLTNSILSGNVFLHTYVESTAESSCHCLTSDLRDIFYSTLSKMANRSDKTVCEYQRKAKSLYKRKIEVSSLTDTGFSQYIADLESSVTDHLSFIKTMIVYCVRLRGHDKWCQASVLALVSAVLIQYSWKNELMKSESNFQKERYESIVQKFFKDPIISRSHSLQLTVVHVMNELQSVYFSLTQLLCLADQFVVATVPGPEYLFCGKLYYNLYLDLSKRKDSLAYVFRLFEDFPCCQYKDFLMEIVDDIRDIVPDFK